MLIGAVDPRGTTNIYAFRSESDNDLNLDGRNEWRSENGWLLSFDDDASKKACEGIKPGEWKEIDLAATDFVHLSPKKTAVQELVEKANDLLLSVSFIDGPDSKNFRIVSVESVSDLHFALARVRQEGGV